MKKRFLFDAKLKDQLTSKKFENEEIVIESPPASICEKVKEFRGHLIANVAHDLRTPLQCIIGYSETVVSKHKSISAEEQLQYMDVILQNANKLSSMIEDFFEYSKLEISEIIPTKSFFSSEKIILELSQNYSLITSKNGLDINFIVEENLPNIYGDYQMIYRVFQNLIDNAIKFTPENGKIDINLIAYSEDELLVEISDTGNGVPYDKLDSIFNKFQMSKDTAFGTGKNNGSGLGLAIVKKILSLHNTRISVNSELGVGTTFMFFLPHK